MNAAVSKLPVPPKADNVTRNASAASLQEPKAPKAAKAPKAPKEPKEPRISNFTKVYPDSAKITLVHDKNPKREGSKAHGTYGLYKNGMTVGDFIKAGGFYAALSWDVGHGFVKVA